MVEGSLYIKPPHGKDQPLPPASWKCKTVSTGQEGKTACGVMCVPPRRSTIRQGTNVISAIWGCAFPPAAGCTKPNQSFEANPTMGEVGHTTVSTICHHVLILITGVRGWKFYERSREIR